MTTGLQQSIEQIRAVDTNEPRQRQFRQEMLDFCAGHPDALHRSCLEGHLTGSAAVVDPGRRAALILHHVKLDRWLQPGGHADGDGDLAAVALREAGEETGIAGMQVVQPAIDLDVHSIPARPGEPEHLHLDVRFVVLAPPNSSFEGNHESHDLDWWDESTVTPELDESTSRLLSKALATLE